MPEYDVTVLQPLAVHHHVAASSKAEARRIIQKLIEGGESDPRIIETFPDGWAGAERIVAVDKIVWRGAASDDFADVPEGSTHRSGDPS